VPRRADQIPARSSRSGLPTRYGLSSGPALPGLAAARWTARSAGRAVMIWAGAVFAATGSVHKLIDYALTSHLGWGHRRGHRRHSRQPGRRTLQARGRPTHPIGHPHRGRQALVARRALSSAGAPLGLLGGLLGARWADPVAGLAMTLFIFHVGWEVTGDAANRHTDGVGPEVITTAEAAVSCLPRIRHVHARAGGPAGRCASGSKLGSTRRSPSVRPTPSGSPQPPRSSKRSRTLDL